MVVNLQQLIDPLIVAASNRPIGCGYQSIATDFIMHFWECKNLQTKMENSCHASVLGDNSFHAWRSL